MKNISGPKKPRQSATFRDCSVCTGKAATEFQDRCLKPLGHPSALALDHKFASLNVQSKQWLPELLAREARVGTCPDELSPTELGHDLTASLRAWLQAGGQGETDQLGEAARPILSISRAKWMSTVRGLIFRS